MPGHSRVERGLEWSTEASDCGLGEPLPKTFVLAFTGGGDGHEFMSENVEDIAGYLHSALGYAPPSSTVGSEHYVLDASKSKIPLKDLSDQLAHLEATMRCCDRLLVYYSGHGMRLVQSVRAGNMLPMWCYVRNTDKSGKTDVSEVTRTCFKDDGVPVSVAEGDQVLATGSGGAKWAMLVGGLALDASTLADRLAKLKSCHITVISDACYSGGFKHRLLEVKGVRTVIAATGEYETREYDPGYSIFGYRTGHGTTFSQALLAGLKSTDVSQSGLDLLWRDGFNDPATLDNDSFAKKGGDSPEIADNEQQCVCPTLCNKDPFYCCAQACNLGATLACVDPCGDFCGELVKNPAVNGDCGKLCGDWIFDQAPTCEELPSYAPTCAKDVCKL